MTVAAIFIQRDAAGTALCSARFSDLRQEHRWRAPSVERVLAEPRETVAALARWTAQHLAQSPGRPDLLIVLDADGAACGWLSADSEEQRVVSAAVREALTNDEEDSASSLGWMTGQAPGRDTSVQALVDVARPRAQRAKGTDAPPARPRVGLLAVCDVTVRLLLDELDKLGVPVRRVTTLWHAMAALSAGAQRAGDRAATDRALDEAPGLTSASVMLLEPQGRLLWAWGSGAGLLCAGHAHLRESLDQPPAEPFPQPRPGARASALRISRGADAGDTTEVEPNDADEGQPPPQAAGVVEVTRADVGRLVTDWIGWSIQLGVSPQRISVVGTPTVTCSGLEFDLPEMTGVAAVAAGVGRAWPGAAVSASLSTDPIGDLLRALVDAEASDQRLPGAAMAADPRLSVLDLSARPGRGSRKLHLWGGLALVAAACGVGVLGWRVGRSTSDLRSGLESAAENRAALLDQATKAGVKFPPDNADPVGVISSRIVAITGERKELREEDPLLAEAVRFLKAADGIPEVQLRSLSFSSQGLATAELMVPAGGDAGPTILERVRASSTGLARQARWEGRAVRVEGAKRQFNYSAKFEDVPPAQRKAVEPPPAPAPSPPATTTPEPNTPAPTDASAPAAPTPAAAPAPSTGGQTP